MPKQITNHTEILEAIRRVNLIDELVEKHNGHFTYELDLEVIAYGRNYTGKKVGPYLTLFVYGPGEEIIREGEWGGNIFYILVEGTLDVYVLDKESQTQKKMNVVQPGRSFGEMSVLAGLKRNATIVVPPNCEATVLAVERPALRLLRKLPKFGDALEGAYREYGLKRILEDLNQASVSAFNAAEMKTLEQIATFRVFGKQHALTSENGLIDRVIFIKNGWVRRARGLGGTAQVGGMVLEVDQEVGVDFLGAGNCLGLEGLQGAENWHYSATVLARTELLEIPIALLRAEPELSAKFLKTFSAFSTGDADLRLDTAADKQLAPALAKEIDTGIVDATNLLVMDMDLCVRCGNCSLACHKVHGESRLLRRGIHIERAYKVSSKASQHVLAPEVCLHCQDPECLTGCPTGAIGRFPGGQIDIEPRTCIGCGDCATQCPYNAITMVPRKRVKKTSALGWSGSWFDLSPPDPPPAVEETRNLLAVKCNLCNNTPLNPPGKKRHAYSCQENCPTGALVRVNPREYFDGARAAVGEVYRGQKHTQ